MELPFRGVDGQKSVLWRCASSSMALLARMADDHQQDTTKIFRTSCRKDWHEHVRAARMQSPPSPSLGLASSPGLGMSNGRCSTCRKDAVTFITFARLGIIARIGISTGIAHTSRRDIHLHHPRLAWHRRRDWAQYREMQYMPQETVSPLGRLMALIPPLLRGR